MFKSGLNYLTDSGLETTLVFNDQLELPCFAAFTLLESKAGRDRLRQYFNTHLAIARRHGAGFILESPTWRANPDWAQELGMDAANLERLNRESISELRLIQQENADINTLISGCIGPRGDGYNPAWLMDATEAQDYHNFQIEVFATEGVDLVTAMTICYPEEAIGIVNAAQKNNVPAVISFTVETNGRLRNGLTLAEAIKQVDAATKQGPLYYMVNCAHPSHFDEHLQGEAWLARIGGIRANASCKSHDELDNSTELDAGDPAALAEDYLSLKQKIPQLRVLGGCCGTDHQHIEAISRACCR